MLPTIKEHVPKNNRRWLSFGLRGIMLLILLLCIPLGWIGQKYHRMRVEDGIVDQILAADGTVIYPHHKNPLPHGGFTNNPNNPAPGPQWLRDQLGDNIFARVHCVWLTKGNVRDEIVATLPPLNDLEILVLRSSSVTDACIDSLLQVSRLKELTLDADKISPQALNRLSSHPTLESLTLYGRLSSPNHLRQLKPWQSLRELEIYTSMANDDDLQAIAGFTNLRKLSLHHLPEVKLHDPNLLAKMTMLQELSIVGSRFTDAPLSHIAQRTRLQKLNLRGSDITDEGLALLKPLTQLRTLNVSDTLVTEKGLQSLSEMKSLEEIIVLRHQGIPSGKVGSATIYVHN